VRVDLVNDLRCPQSGEKLALRPAKMLGNEVLDGVLISPIGAAYPIRRGVPCMTPSPDTFSFSFEWTLHSMDDLTWEMKIPERLSLFWRYFNISPKEARGRRLLDAGCGNGTLSAALAKEGLEVFALDYSTSVYRAFQKQLFDADAETLDRLHYIQGDVMQAPFADDSFDFVYSDGVLHHTPDTKAAFMALARKVRSNGQFFVWLYRKDLDPVARLKLTLVKLGRRVLKGIPHRGKLPLCYAGAAILLGRLKLMRLLGYRRREMIPLRLKALNLFDTFSPTFNHEHTEEEVRGWFREAGFVTVRDVAYPEYRFNDEGVAIVGTRPG